MDKQTEIVGYWAVAMLNYRQPKGEKALGKLRELTDADTVGAIMFITGYCQSGKVGNIKQMWKLAEPIEEEFD